MTKITIIYMDGYEEHYNMIPPTDVTDATRLKRFKDIVEDGILKLVVEDSQIVFIPISNIRKIISQADETIHIKMKDYPGFMNVKAPLETI